MIYYDKDNIIVRTSNIDDVEYLSTRLRQSDIDEVWASHNHTPHEALKISLERSTLCLTIVDNNIPIAMFGINPDFILSDKAVIWFLSSDGIYKIKKRFLRNCKIFINMMLDQYEILYNFVDARNTDSIKWLKSLGADISAPFVFGSERMKFCYFSFKRDA